MEWIVLGGGESGVGAALLAQKKGLPVFLSDRGALSTAKRAELLKAGIDFEEGEHDEERILGAKEVIKSPGIPDTAPLLIKLKERGVPVVSEIEFASRYTNGFIIGITGTNGKTTTTKLCFHLLKEAGYDVAMGGNVGKSFARLLTEKAYAYYVLELSSFQLDGIDVFKPRISMLLNVSPDHLDRYGYQMEAYVASKFRIQMNQEETDYFLYWKEASGIEQELKKVLGSVSAEALSSKQLQNSLLKVGDETFDLSKSVLQGRHNGMNALFAVRAAQIVGASSAAIQQGLATFSSVPHRMEPVGEYEGIRFINDSKATNVDAVFFALDAMTAPVIWIVGGTDKGNDYTPLLSLVKEKVKVLIGLGVDNTKVIEAFGPLVERCIEVSSANEAVEKALLWGQTGDVVLLAPACASFDRFKNYEQRGDRFREAVQALKK